MVISLNSLGLTSLNIGFGANSIGVTTFSGFSLVIFDIVLSAVPKMAAISFTGTPLRLSSRACSFCSSVIYVRDFLMIMSFLPTPLTDELYTFCGYSFLVLF